MLPRDGPMARTSEDCALILAAIMGADPKDRATLGVTAREPVLPAATRLDGLRIGVVRHFSDGPDLATPDVNAALDAAVHQLAALGASMRDASPGSRSVAGGAGSSPSVSSPTSWRR